MMNEIPPEVQRFMLANIPSILHMEALMLARASTPARWREQALSERFYITPAKASEVLENLHSAGLLQRDLETATYFYPPHPHAGSGVIEQVAALYASNLVGITALIHSTTERPPQQNGAGCGLDLLF